MINCLSLSCCFRLSVCSFKAIISAESLFEHFCFLSVVKPSEASVLQDAYFVTIMWRYSKMFTDIDVNFSSDNSFWSRYVYTKRNLLELRLMYTSAPFKQMLLPLKWNLCFYFLKVFWKYIMIPRIPIIPCIPCIPRTPTIIPHIFTLIPRIPTMILRIPTLIPCIPTLIPRIPNMTPCFPTLIPRIPIISLIPFPDSRFRVLQTAHWQIQILFTRRKQYRTRIFVYALRR